ncbi:hypothetical protein [Hyphomicrobium sp.]|uniref:hypothetical protein n=1 Tax=Hyphomicrobium sp. TaxID=82 RepID=UPI0025C53F2F|nr:hypothetical protein [Hyphomicrobium sp.]
MELVVELLDEEFSEHRRQEDAGHGNADRNPDGGDDDQAGSERAHSVPQSMR